MAYFEYYDKPKPEFSELVGKTLTEIRGGKVGEDRIEFVCSDGAVYVMYHGQDCCESVSIESITGDIADLIGTPILVAEEATSDKDPEGYKPESEYRESFSWTFYKLATVKGWIDMRWLGESNGYYSESVDFVRLVEPTSSPDAGVSATDLTRAVNRRADSRGVTR